MASKHKSNELKISRLYDAPLQAVWDAWTDPEAAEEIAQFIKAASVCSYVAGNDADDGNLHIRE